VEELVGRFGSDAVFYDFARRGVQFDDRVVYRKRPYRGRQAGRMYVCAGMG
jgi:hypothetical protein